MDNELFQQAFAALNVTDYSQLQRQYTGIPETAIPVIWNGHLTREYADPMVAEVAGQLLQSALGVVPRMTAIFTSNTE